MTSVEDPPFLRELGHELPAELRRALSSSPAEDADPRELARVRANVERALAQAERSAARPARPARRLRSRATSLALTFAVGAAAGTVVSTGLVYWFRAPAGVEAPNVSEPSPPLAAPSHSPEPSRAPPEDAVRPIESAAPEAPARFPAPPARSSRERPSASEARTAPADELAILARAQAALASSPKAALALVAEHERNFPGNGALAQEREVIAIDALLRLGRTTEARSRAQRFHRQYPSSAHGRRVDVLFEVR